jgi:tRNA threonylcarbamoyladenosine biosynthesis protein TsaB
VSAPWLAIDTATDVASVAFGSAERVSAARSVRGARQHAAQIVPLIQQVLTLAAARIEEVAALVVGDGPGSFTGLRIGWAAAKGIAHERDLPLRTVPSLLGAAHAAAQGEVGPIAVCYDALRGQVFGAIYAFPADRVEILVAPALFTLAGLARIAPVRPLLAVGDGAQRYGDEVLSWTGRPAVGLESLPPVAGSLLALAERSGASRAIDAAANAEPVYGRPAEAQVKWEAHHGRPLPHSSR